jgi:heptaprenyl diphosphate synthase
VSPKPDSPVGIEFDDAQLEASVRAGLDAVEATLRVAVQTDDPFVAEAGRYLVEAGGKRFRPLVSLLASHFGDASRPEIVPAAVVVELTHLATLYHDDVMDEALVRRGAASPNARWGNTIAILVGDFLFARASDLLADLGPHAVRVQARTFERLVKGQIHETVGPGAGVDPIEHYLTVLADKTGSLIATAAEFGAYFAGATPEVIAQLRLFGEQIGVAFQLSDDIIDIVSDSTESGKTPGTDLREGIATLPTLYVLRSTDPEGAELRDLLARPLPDDAEHARALVALRSSPAIGQARATLLDYVATARGLLAVLPDVPARGALEALTESVIARTG